MSGTQTRTAAPEAAVLFHAEVLLLMRWEGDGVRQLKADYRFRGERNVAVIAGHRSTCGSRASSDESADCSAFAAAGKAADQGTCACAATDESGSALSFTGGLLTINTRTDGIACAADRDGLERNAKACRPLKFACGFGIGDGATYLRSSRDRSHPSDGHRIGQRSSEPLPSGAVL